MRLSLDALQVLDAIERGGSFAAAALELHRVPSAITYTVQQLEQDLGLMLFDRRGHRAKLTGAGFELLTEGWQLLRAATDLTSAFCRCPSPIASNALAASRFLLSKSTSPVVKPLSHGCQTAPAKHCAGLSSNFWRPARFSRCYRMTIPSQQAA